MERIDSGSIRSEAARSGLVLGLVTVAFMFLSQLAGGLGNAFAQSALGFLLWLAKVVTCVVLMRAFMKRLVGKYEGVTNRDTFRLGLWVALFSALIYSAMSLVNMLYISPGLLDEAYAMIYGQMGAMLDSNSRQALAEIQPKLPAISFFSNLIYCFLYGTVLSSILSRGVPQPDPFADAGGEGVDNQ